MIQTEKGTAGDTHVLFLACEIGNSRKSRNSQLYCLYIADTVKKLLGR